MYYNNIECEVISKLNDYESVIEIDTGSEAYRDEFGTYEEPISRKLIVNNKHLTENEITFASIIKEKEQILKEASLKAKEILNTANKKIREEYNELNEAKKELLKNKDIIQKENEYYQTAINLRNGIYRYVVYGFRIMSFEDFKNKVAKECTYEDEPDFEDISLKISNNMLTYKKSGHWGSEYVDLCETKEKAVEILIQKIKVLDNLNIDIIKEMRTHEINIDGLSEKINSCIKKHNDDILKNISNYETQINNQKDRLYNA